MLTETLVTPTENRNQNTWARSFLVQSAPIFKVVENIALLFAAINLWERNNIKGDVLTIGLSSIVITDLAQCIHNWLSHESENKQQHYAVYHAALIMALLVATVGISLKEGQPLGDLINHTPTNTGHIANGFWELHLSSSLLIEAHKHWRNRQDHAEKPIPSHLSNAFALAPWIFGAVATELMREDNPENPAVYGFATTFACNLFQRVIPSVSSSSSREDDTQLPV